MKTLKSIYWTMHPVWLIGGILVLAVGHSWYGWLILAAAVRQTKEYYE